MKFITPEERKKREQEEIQALLSITDEDIEKMDYKTKQKYFRDRSKICKVVKVTRKKEK